MCEQHYFFSYMGSEDMGFFKAHRWQEMTMVDLKGRADLIVEFCKNLSLKMTGNFISNY